MFCGQFDSAQMGRKRRLSISELPDVAILEPGLRVGKTQNFMGSVGPGVLQWTPVHETQVQSEVPGLSFGPLAPTPNQWLSQEAGVKALPPLTAL